MSKFLLLSVTAVSDQTIDIVKIVSIIAVCLIIVAVLLLSFTKGISDTRVLVNGAVCIAVSFALSFFKYGMPYGGSVTLASFVPLIIYSYAYGPIKGLMVGLIFSVLQFLQEPWFLTPVQLLLDYPLAFSSIALASVFKKSFKNKTTAVILGCLSIFVFRLFMHTFAGMIFFSAGYVNAALPTSSAFIYSLVYNLTYVPLDMLLSILAIVYLLKSNTFDRLIKMLIKN